MNALQSNLNKKAAISFNLRTTDSTTNQIIVTPQLSDPQDMIIPPSQSTHYHPASPIITRKVFTNHCPATSCRSSIAIWSTPEAITCGHARRIAHTMRIS